MCVKGKERGGEGGGGDEKGRKKKEAIPSDIGRC